MDWRRRHWWSMLYVYTFFPNLQTFHGPRNNKQHWFGVSLCPTVPQLTDVRMVCYALLCLPVDAKPQKFAVEHPLASWLLNPFFSFFQVYKNRLIVVDRALAQTQYTHSTGISLTHVLLFHPTVSLNYVEYFHKHNFIPALLKIELRSTKCSIQQLLSWIRILPDS